MCRNLFNLSWYFRMVQISWQKSIFDCLFYYFKKHRCQRNIIRIRARYKKQTDVRRIIMNSLSIQDFFRCFLTVPQQTLMNYQRSRLILDGTNPDDNSSTDVEQPLNTLCHFKSMQILRAFQPASGFDNRLVKGIIYRKGIVPKDKKD